MPLFPISQPGSGAVATDVIWAAKGDLAVGTGANTASKLTVGANGTIPVAASGESTGIKWTHGGKLVQRVSTELTSTFSTTTVMPGDNTTPQNTEGGEVITLAITPTSVSNKLVIRVTSYFSASTLLNVVGAIFRDSTADALKSRLCGAVPAVDYALPLDVTFEVTPNSTSSQTYKFRFGATAAGTVVVNRLYNYTPLLNSTGVILMEIMEIAP